MTNEFPHLLRTPGRLIPALLCAAVFPSTSSAQTVTGRLLDRETGVPGVPSYVVLVDTGGREVSRTQTGPEGGFMLRGPADGEYRLHAERIGFEVSQSESVHLQTGQVAEFEFRTSFVPVRLIEFARALSPSCLPHTDATPATLAVWQEVRKNLNAVWWTASYRSHRYQARTYERDIAVEGGNIRREQSASVSDLQGTLFAAGDPEQLAAEGYVVEHDDGSLSYFAPDPAALLHPNFLETHCLALSRNALGSEIGLRFEPVSGRPVADIAGTAWLDMTTAELLRVDFRYTSDPAGIDHDDVGGVIEFSGLRSADRMVSGWRLRMPSVGASTDPATGARTLFGFTELGGNVTRVSDATGAALFEDETVAILSGTIFDSTSAMPLAGAVVILAGTDHWSTTDERGEFFMAQPVEGDYGLVFGHPRLDSLGFVSPVHPVSLHRETPTSLRLAVPSLPTIVNERCEGAMQSAQRRVLVGIVKDGDTRQPASGVLVSVSWQPIPTNLQREFGVEDLRASAVTDSLGMYALCGVPLRRSIEVHASRGTRMSDVIPLVFRESGIEIGGNDLYPLDRPVARLDLNLIAPDQRNTTVLGFVTDATSGGPLPGATVQVGTTPFTAQTDSTGAFRFDGVPPGSHELTVRRLGFELLRYEVDIASGIPLTLAPTALVLVPLGDEVVILDPIVVEAERITRDMVGFEERRRTGIGNFLSRLDFEDWNPTVATDVLRRMRGMRVRPNPRYGFNGDSRRWLIESRRDIGARITRIVPGSSPARSPTPLGGGSSDIMITECPVLLFVDGVYIGDSAATDVDNLVTVMNLTAVEVYTSSQVPARFNLPGATCGVAVFWTK